MEESFVFVPQGSDLVENMDDLEAKAKDWISKSNLNYKVEVNKEEKKIIFKTDEGFSFYVMGPDQDGKFVWILFHFLFYKKKAKFHFLEI